MLKDPVMLIDETISNLETLQDIFQEEFDALTHRVDAVNVNGTICRHAHFKISTLLPVLRAARQTQEAPASRSHCMNCD